MEVTEEMILQKYEKFAKENGELYEEATKPLTPDDLILINKGIKKFLILLLAAFIVTEGILYLALYDDLEHQYVIWLVAAGLVLVGAFQLYTYKSIKEKEIIKGVITDKSQEQDRSSTRYYVHLSGNSSGVRVGRRDYEVLHFGKIVEIETIPGSFSSFGKIRVLGEI